MNIEKFTMNNEDFESMKKTSSDEMKQKLGNEIDELENDNI